MFGSQTVIHCEDNTWGEIRETTTQRILRVEVANLPAAGVKENEYGERTAALRAVYPDRQFAPWARNGQVFHPGHRFWCRSTRLHGFKHCSRPIHSQVRSVDKAH